MSISHVLYNVMFNLGHKKVNVGHKKGMMKVGRKIKIHTVPVSPEPEYQDDPMSLVNIFGGKKDTSFKSFRLVNWQRKRIFCLVSCSVMNL